MVFYSKNRFRSLKKEVLGEIWLLKLMKEMIEPFMLIFERLVQKGKNLKWYKIVMNRIENRIMGKCFDFNGKEFVDQKNILFQLGKSIA